VNTLDRAAGHPAESIDDYIASLAATLHGPARAKARLIEEMRDGLVDTVAAHTHEGLSHQGAVREAVREFGSPDELAPSCQRELTIAQTRHTARSLVLTAPFLIACWHLIWTTDHYQERRLAQAAELLAMNLAGVAAVAALCATVALVATGTLARRLRTPHRLPLVVAWTGTAASVAIVITTLALAAAAPLATSWPLVAFAGALSAGSHAVVAASARACRRCARLSIGEPSSPAHPIDAS
jgi:hypothetical protein